MTKQLSIMAALICAAMMLFSCSEKPIPADQLPEAAKAYIEQQFPGQKVLFAEKDPDLFNTTYDVKLDNGMELTFDSDGMLIDVDD